MEDLASRHHHRFAQPDPQSLRTDAWWEHRAKCCKRGNTRRVELGTVHRARSGRCGRFEVVHVKPYLQPGTTVALRCLHHGRCLLIYPGAPQALLMEKENHTQSHTQKGTSFWGGLGGLSGLFGGGVSSFDPTGEIKRAAEEEARRQQEEAEERAGQEALRGTIGRSAPRTVDNFPDSWTYERLTVIDAGCHNSLHNRYLKMAGPRMLVSSPMAPDAYPSGWTWEGFTVIPAGHGQFVFHNSSHNRMVRMTTDKADSSRHMSPQDLPGGWTWERFQIVPVRPYLQSGTVVALHCGIRNRYVSLNGAELQRSEVRNLNDLPSNWVWERFTVVDAGNGQVAFHNTAHNRFIQSTSLGSTDPRGASDFQSGWTWERFTVQRPHGDSGPAMRLGALSHRSSFRTH
ncbi:unnamed protein product [Symbiodinium sp. KB8]|nr:unnamed protein product [Symbiodinium sp. KB8]